MMIKNVEHGTNNQAVVLETDSNLFVDNVIYWLVKEYSHIDKKMERSGFSFKFVGSLSVRCDKENEPYWVT